MQKLIQPLNHMHISSGYKASGYTARFNMVHYALDSYSSSGDVVVRASGTGTLLSSGLDHIFGNFMVIRYNSVYNHHTGKTQDIIARYYHLSKILVKNGASFSAGDSLAHYGATGEYVTGAHLHFECDTDVNYPMNTPSLSGNSNYLKAGIDTTVDPTDLLYTKSGTQSYSADTDSYNGKPYVEPADRTLPVLTPSSGSNGSSGSSSKPNTGGNSGPSGSSGSNAKPSGNNNNTASEDGWIYRIYQQRGWNDNEADAVKTAKSLGGYTFIRYEAKSSSDPTMIYRIVQQVNWTNTLEEANRWITDNKIYDSFIVLERKDIHIGDNDDWIWRIYQQQDWKDNISDAVQAAKQYGGNTVIRYEAKTKDDPTKIYRIIKQVNWTGTLEQANIWIENNKVYNTFLQIERK
ncbi:M23 family metallopeptidase [Candidatus Soleaferrea massiliensis]|uniref:M23 family metallopeptidase n=1 Tax=Candidatus Soleaferrea massiliensis TaxID=1470354 RepID=UPI00058B1D2A|nr:M23 family metallopeptidase [Candidatus Soleaferrea massiliensis]